MQPRGLSQDMLGWAQWLRSRRWFWILLPLWCYLMALTFTNTWWFKRKVHEKFLPIAGLDASYDGLWWFPGFPLVVDGWRLKQIEPLRAVDPQPIIRLQRVIIELDWSHWRHPMLAIRRVEVHQPSLRLSVELFAGVMRLIGDQIKAQALTAEPSVVAKSPNDAKPSEQLAQQAPLPEINQNGVVKNDASSNLTSALPAPAVTKPEIIEMMGPPHLVNPPVVQRPIDPRKSWRLILHDGAVEIYSNHSRENRLQMDGIAADIPIQGADASGMFKVDALRWKGQCLQVDSVVPLRWHFPILETPVLPWEWQGIKGEAQIQLARQPGLPFMVGVSMRENSVPCEERVWGVQKLTGNLQCLGYAMSPLSIQAQMQLAAKNIEIAYHHQSSRFDRLSLLAQLRQGVLNCADFRLIGDTVSLLGNGIVALDGRHAGVMRFVLPPQAQPYAASTWTAFFPRLPLNLKPFVTEDRIVGEVEISGHLQQTLITANQGQTIGDARALLWEMWQQRRKSP